MINWTTIAGMLKGVRDVCSFSVSVHWFHSEPENQRNLQWLMTQSQIIERKYFVLFISFITTQMPSFRFPYWSINPAITTENNLKKAWSELCTLVSLAKFSWALWPVPFLPSIVLSCLFSVKIKLFVLLYFQCQNFPYTFQGLEHHHCEIKNGSLDEENVW